MTTSTNDYKQIEVSNLKYQAELLQRKFKVFIKVQHAAETK